MNIDILWELSKLDHKWTISSGLIDEKYISANGFVYTTTIINEENLFNALVYLKAAYINNNYQPASNKDG